MLKRLDVILIILRYPSTESELGPNPIQIKEKNGRKKRQIKSNPAHLFFYVLVIALACEFEVMVNFAYKFLKLIHSYTSIA